MANPQHLAILQEGTKRWNHWRTANTTVSPNLNSADLSGQQLRDANLQHADLSNAKLSEADLTNADLSGATLYRADLRRALLLGARLTGAYLSAARLDGGDLTSAELQGADLTAAHLSGARLFAADLQHAHLVGANLDGAMLGGTTLRRADLHAASLDGVFLTECDLRETKLTQTDLMRATLQQVDLGGASLEGARLGFTVLADSNLEMASGLPRVRFAAPCTVGIDTLRRSLGRICTSFLEGCGLADWEIAAAKLFDPQLHSGEITDLSYEIIGLRAASPIQVSALFISYSHRDARFVDALGKGFDSQGIRYWRDSHDMVAGRMERQIDRAIRLNPRVLLVLSRNSLQSDWVEFEAAKARELEKELRRDVLCPVALDEEWKTCDWPGVLRRQIEDYYVLDFSRWEDGAVMKRQFRRLLEGLALFYAREGEADR